MPQEFIYTPPQEPFLSILFDDGEVMVVDKPTGLLSVPGKKKEYHDSILSRVRQRYPAAQAVHRLDLGTSGVMAVGLTKASVSALGRQFMHRTPRKVYVARVWGIVREDEGRIDMPMRTDLDNRPYQIVDYEHGRSAITYYQVLRRLEGENVTVVRLYPQTGRSHQLRLHLQQIGHPILGDHLYASSEAFEASDRLCLHAAALSFDHPSSSERMEFCAPAPFDLGGVAVCTGWLGQCPFG